MILDTSVVVDLLRRERTAIIRIKSLEASGEMIWIPAPAIFEIWEGIARADRPRQEADRVSGVLDDYTLQSFESRHAARAGRLSGELGRQGIVVDPLNAQIAGIALEERQPVLTRNLRDFQRFPDLKVVAY
jgi:predicted nucleic acid-binding protein